MLMMSLPAVLTPVAAVLAAVTALVTALVATIARPSRSNLPTYHDPEQAIADLTLKVRHPLTYRVRQVERWMSGE
jgi:hypothetical protein